MSYSFHGDPDRFCPKSLDQLSSQAADQMNIAPTPQHVRRAGTIVIDEIGIVEQADAQAIESFPQLKQLDSDFMRIDDLFVDKIEFDSEIGLFNATTQEPLGWRSTLAARSPYGPLQATIDVNQIAFHNADQFNLFISDCQVNCNCREQSERLADQGSQYQPRSEIDRIENSIENDINDLIDFADKHMRKPKVESLGDQATSEVTRI